MRFKMSLTNRAITIIILGSLMFTVSAAGVYTSTLTVNNRGWLGVVGIYFDSNCTLPAQMLNWSTVYPGQTANQTVYLKNFGDNPVLVNMTTTNWNPVNASQYFTVTWDHEGMSVNPGAEQAIIYLTVPLTTNSSSGISSFSFDISIKEAWT